MLKKTTLEKLARMTQEGFLGVHSELREAYKREQVIVDTLDLMRADIRDIKIAMGPLLRTVSALEEQVRIHDKRIERLEKKISLAK